MKCLLTLYLMLLLDSVLGSLPAPVNVSVISVNFHHVLRWDPGPGTPTGTQYIVYWRVNKKKKSQNTTKTSFTLKLNNEWKYYLTVRASYNQTLSPESRKVTFTPYEDTKIGPPKLSLAGCGDCLQVNVSMPTNVRKYYRFSEVFLRKFGDETVQQEYKEGTSFSLTHLEKGQKYCVMVKLNVMMKEGEPSAWTCSFTSIVDPRRAHIFLGVGAALLFLAIGVLMSFMFCLDYTGFLCKLKSTLPRALIVRRTTLTSGQILTPEMTFPELIAVIAEMGKQNNPTVPNPAEEEDYEEEEDEEENAYMDRGAGLSSGESSCQDSPDVSGNGTLPASVKLSPEVEEADAEFDREGLDRYEAKNKGAEVSLVPEGGQTQVQAHEEEKEDVKLKEEACHTSRNINLLSVTVAALAVSEEEEEEEQNTFFLELSDREPLLPTDSQTESHDLITVALIKKTGYESRTGHTSSGETEEEDEEEEEEFSGYMGRT